MQLGRMRMVRHPEGYIMIVKKIWTAHTHGGTHEWYREGFYLFGFIPLYIRDLTTRERKYTRG